MKRHDDTFRKYSKRYFGTAVRLAVVQGPGDGGSNLQMTAKSWAGARGIMQLMLTTLHETRSKNPEITGR